MADVHAAALLGAAREVFDGSSELAELARAVRWRGFAGGGQWMRAALGGVRGAEPAEVRVGFVSLGVRKYLLAGGAATPFVVAAAYLGQPWLLALAIVAFYAIEVRMVFAFPLAIDGQRQPLRASHRLVARHHGACRATWTVVQLAAVMLFGGLLGRGWIRSWCLGCLGVVVWYERLGGRSAAT